MQYGQNIANQGREQAHDSECNQGQGVVSQGQRLVGEGQQFLDGAQLAQQSTTIGQPDISLGRDLISGNQAIDPLVQQELMRSGLGSAASALGGAAAFRGNRWASGGWTEILALEPRTGLISSASKEWRCSRLGRG